MENNIPKDILDGVRDAFGRRVKLSVKRLVKYEVKPDKIESRILILTNWRVFLLSAKAPFRHDVNIHLLDIRSIESKKPNQLTIGTADGKKISLVALEVETEEFDHVIINIGTNLKNVFPHVALERLTSQIDVVPASRIKSMYDMIKDIEGREPGPCGGFSRMYACMCDYNFLPYREEVTWDIDTIYLSQDNKELRLGDFDHLESRDLVPIIAALEYNNWFLKLNASDVKLCSEAAAEILKVMQKNTSVEELLLSGIGVKNDFAQKLSTALLSNANSSLTTIDLSNNYIEDRGMNQLSGPVSKLSKGLACLKLAKTGITAKGVNRLAESLATNRVLSTSLKELDLSENNMRGEEVTSLYNFLAQPNAICTLNLSGTECALDMISGALLRGCCSHLEYLDLSKNVFTHKKMKEISVPLTWKQYFGNCLALKSVNLADNKLPPEAVKNLLLGLSTNTQLHDLEVNLRGNDLRGAGAQVLEICLPDLTNVTNLNISDNGFGEDIVRVLQKLLKNKVLTKLAIGQNFNSVKSKHIQQVLESVVQFIDDENCPIKSLSIANSKLGKDTAVIINALGSNTSITELDISGNYMGDLGARMLAKALMINTHLTAIYWDKNVTSAQGFTDVAAALEKNYTVKKMPTPVNDAASALRSSPEKTESALEKIEALLQRNHSPRKFACDQAYRLQQCFLISSTQQVLDRQVVQIQDTINALHRGPINPPTQTDIAEAQLLLKDADNSKLLLPRLQEVALKSEAEGNVIDLKLRSVAQDILLVTEQQLHKNVAEMLTSASEHCPTITKDTELTQEVKDECAEKSTLPKDFTRGLVVEQVGTDTMNKVSELNLAVASYVSERLIDNVIESLTETHKTLTNRLNEQLAQNRAEQKKLKVTKEDELSIGPDKDSDTEKPSPGTSPKPVNTKRKSLHIRKVRPQSQIDPKDVKQALREFSGNSDKLPEGGDSGRGPASPIAEEEGSNDENLKSFDIEREGDGRKEMLSVDVNDSAEDARKAAMLPNSQTLPEFPTDLPPVETTTQLTHVTKSRPKRARTKPPSRTALMRTDGDQTPGDGLGTFFQSSTQSTTIDSPKIEINSVPETEVTRAVSPTKTEHKKPSGWSPFGGASFAHNIQSGINKFLKKSPLPKNTDVTKRYSMISEEGSSRNSDPPPSPTVKRTVSAKQDDKVDTSENTADDNTKPETVTEKEDEPESPKEPIIRKPTGVPRVGLPGMAPGMLAEMRARRTTFGSKSVKAEDNDKKETASVSPSVTAIKERPLSVKSPAPPVPNSEVTQRSKEEQLAKPMPVPRTSSPAQREASLKPTPTPRAPSPKGFNTPGDRTSKPPPPTIRPKPNFLAPKPKPKPKPPTVKLSEEPKVTKEVKEIGEEKRVSGAPVETLPQAFTLEEKATIEVKPAIVKEEEKTEEPPKREESKALEGVSVLDANRNETIVMPSYIKTKSASLPRSPKVEHKGNEPARSRSLHEASKRHSDDFHSKQAALGKLLSKNGNKTPDSSSTDSLLEDASIEEQLEEESTAVKISIISESSTDSPVPPEPQSSSGKTSEDEDLMSEENEITDLIQV